MNVKMPSIKSVTATLIDHKRCCAYYDGSEIDVRLQVVSNGDWCIHTGDSQFDRDHRGHWGCGRITRSSNCRDVARDLINQCAESAATTPDE